MLKSSSAVELTESETEYVVTAVKHIFKQHFVLQYDIKNTLPDAVLEDVSVIATPEEEADDPSVEEDFLIPAPKLVTNEPSTVYVAFKKLETASTFPTMSFSNNLKFTSKEIDPSTGEADTNGYEDEYEVDALELTGADYVFPLLTGNFDHAWEGAGAKGEEASETLQLSNMKSLSGESQLLAALLLLATIFGHLLSPPFPSIAITRS